MKKPIGSTESHGPANKRLRTPLPFHPINLIHTNMNAKVFFAGLSVVCVAAGALSLKRMDAVTDSFQDPARKAAMVKQG